MALKFGQLFDDMFSQGFKKIADNFNKKFSNLDTEEIKNAADYLKTTSSAMAELNKEAEETAKSIITLQKELKTTDKGTYQYIAKQKKLNDLLKKSLDLDKKAEKSKKESMDADKDYKDLKDKTFKTDKSNWDKWASTFSDASSKFEKDLDSLVTQFKKGEVDSVKFEDELKHLEFKKFGEQASDLLNTNVKSIFSKGGGALKGQLAGWSKTILSKLGPMGTLIGTVLIAGVTEAIEQVLHLNNALIALQRETGGMVNAAKLGFDEFGNGTKQIQSLTTTLASANISLEQFSGSMKDLFSGALKAGQIAGLTDNLAKSAKELKNYGVEAARIEKLYGAKIGPAVSGLLSNFGMGIKDATKFVKQGVDTARSLGLNVAAFTENLKEATDLAGELYFKTTEELTKLAGLATQLGVSVNSIAKGVTNMNGVLGLFEQQQKVASLGMQTLGHNLSKIYALRQTGKQGEAAQVELQSIAKDLMRNGLTNKEGGVTQQGIATLQATGANKEQIEALQRMSRNATKAGIALDKAFDPKSLTEEQKRRLASVEKENMTVEEMFSSTFGKLKGAVIDPIAKIVGPALKGFADIISMAVDLIVPLINMIGDLITTIIHPFQVAGGQIIAILHDIFDPVINLFKKAQESFGGLMAAVRSISGFIVKVLFVPFRILGKIIGGVVTVFGKIFSVISDALAPAFEWISELFDGGSEKIDSFLGAIGDAFGWLADFVGGALSASFKLLGFFLKPIVAVLKWLWTGLKKIGSVVMEFLQPAFDFLGSVIGSVADWFKSLIEGVKKVISYFDWFGDDENKQGGGLTKDDWKDVLGVDDTGKQVVNAEGKKADISTKQVAESQEAALNKLGDMYKATAAEKDAAAKEASDKSKGGNVSITNKVDGIFNNNQTIKV